MFPPDFFSPQVPAASGCYVIPALVRGANDGIPLDGRGDHRSDKILFGIEIRRDDQDQEMGFRLLRSVRWSKSEQQTRIAQGIDINSGDVLRTNIIPAKAA